MNNKAQLSMPHPQAVTESSSHGDTGTTPALWEDSARENEFNSWLAQIGAKQGLVSASLRPASADAGFRRYLRIDTKDQGTRIVMDAPPALENCTPFVKIATLLRAAKLNVPEILEWDEANGFMLLSDLGGSTMLDSIDPSNPGAARPLYLQAVEALVELQLASRPDVLPPYDEQWLRGEMQLFPDWYLAHHRALTLTASQIETLNKSFDLIVARNLAAPMVYVHRDFMPRNLMPSASGGAMGVLDFQDARYGPITYDIASLMRDAFISWDEEFVLDITIRYWERAKKAGLMEFEDWSTDFGSFWRAVEWMGLQRHLKVAGIFARLSLRDGKPKYLADAPRFINYIRHTASRYRELTPLLRLVDEIEGTGAATGWAFGRV